MKRVLIILSLLQIFILSSCWDYEPVDNSIILGGIGIDKTDDTYLLSLEMFVPIEYTESALGTSPTRVMTIEVNSISELRTQITKYVGNNLFHRNIRIVILSKRVATEGLSEILDPLLRNNSMRVTLVTMTLDESPKDILNMLPPFKMDQSDSIKDSIRLSSRFGNMPNDINVVNVSTKVIKQGIDPYIPIITVTGNDETNVEDKKNTELNSYTSINNIGLFHKDKYVSKLDKYESQIISFIMQNQLSTIYTIKHENCNYTIDIKKMKKQISSDYTNKSPVFNINLELRASLVELGCKNELEVDDVKIIENLFEQEIKNRLKETLIKTQNHKSDVVGFGEIFRRQDNDNWKKVKDDWSNVYSTCDFNIDISVDIEDTGVLGRTVISDDEVKIDE